MAKAEPIFPNSKKLSKYFPQLKHKDEVQSIYQMYIIYTYKYFVTIETLISESVNLKCPNFDLTVPSQKILKILSKMYLSQYRLALDRWVLKRSGYKKFKKVFFQYGGWWKSSGYKNLEKPSPGFAAQIIPSLQSQNSTLVRRQLKRTF